MRRRLRWNEDGPRYVAAPARDSRRRGPRHGAPRELPSEVHAVYDVERGKELAYLAYANDAYWLAALLDALSSGAWPEDVLLGEGEHRRFLRRIELKREAVCWRCGRPMKVGAAAYWHPISRAVRHVGACAKAEPQPKRSAKRKRAA